MCSGWSPVQQVLARFVWSFASREAFRLEICRLEELQKAEEGGAPPSLDCQTLGWAHMEMECRLAGAHAFESLCPCHTSGSSPPKAFHQLKVGARQSSLQPRARTRGLQQNCNSEHRTNGKQRSNEGVFQHWFRNGDYHHERTWCHGVHTSEVLQTKPSDKA